MQNLKKYNIGLDIGTNSVGWAVVESGQQKIIKKGGKALWGVRLFDTASTAKDRRLKRSTRRHYDRRRQRIKLLQDEFANEINKVDSEFYKKLQDSFISQNDKNNIKTELTDFDKFNIFSNNIRKKINNISEEKKYPTIYHLRNDLVNSKDKKDIRLVYLAIHHIIKYRGNFLYENSNFNVNNINLKEKIEETFNHYIEECMTGEFNVTIDYEKIADILLKDSKNEIKDLLKEELLIFDSYNKGFSSEFVKMIVGNKFKVEKLIPSSNEEKSMSISFNGNDFDEENEKLMELLGQNIEILEEFKELYDNVFLKRLFKGSESNNISSLMINIYDEHKKDLKMLKKLFKSNKKIYNELFKNENCKYEEYIHNKITQEDFCKIILNSYEKLGINKESIDFYNKNLKSKIENNLLLPRISEPSNGKYPFQLNRDELIKIIDNQKLYYDFLGEKMNDKYKLVKLLEFKIPYYVGPLVSSDKSCFAWMERNDNKKITPYNFDEIVNKELTAEKFIKRMISHCTYFINEPALPSNSLLYNKFKVLNELKQIKVNDRKMTLEQQQNAIKDLFEKTSGTITEKKFINYLKQTKEWDMYSEINIKGYSADKKFANNMQSYVDFFGKNGIFDNTNYNEENAEEIIEWITIFNDKEILESKVRNTYPDLTDNQVTKILRKKYSGWGELSKKLLSLPYYKDKETEVYKSIIDLMFETKENFMQILNNDEYKFQNMIKENNKIKNTKKLNYKDTVSELATSPAVKRGIFQSLKIIEEIVDYMGYEPESVSIEMSRGDDKKERKPDRKKYLTELYKKSKDSIENYNKLNKQLGEKEIDSQKLFLYFIQEGKCMYCGKSLNVEDMISYEIDHIIPRTLIKDDSIDNKVLVHKECNQNKAASFVLPPYYRSEYNKKWWTRLKNIGLMSNKKYNNLVREKYSEDDINRFINRQLVETRQIIKHVANIIENYYDTKVIYLKANLSHNYRERYELYKFRELNDYHHAHDAYLAAVLGEYKEKYMKYNITYDLVRTLNNKIKEKGQAEKLKYGFIINSLDSDVSSVIDGLNKNKINEKTGEIIFSPDAFNKTIENNLYRNDILISYKTEYNTGEFYNQTIYGKGKGNIRLKDNLPTEIYGGYSGVNVSYFMLVEYKGKRKIIGIPILIAKNNNEKDLNDYIINQINSSEYRVLKNKIPYDTLFEYKGQQVYIKGYSSKNKNGEISNAIQLKISKELYLKWKYALNRILNNKENNLNESEYKENLIEILNYLLQLNDYYPLFDNEIIQIKKYVEKNNQNLGIKDFEKIIKQLLIVYKCSSENANLKEFGLKDRIGRLTGKVISEGTIIYKSITGIREKKYEF